MKRAFLFKLCSRSLLAVALFLCSSKIQAQTLVITSPVATASYCAGVNLNISYSISPASFSAANVFSAQISDNSGSFAGSPVTIGVLTSSVNGSIVSTLPSTLLTSGLYRFRVISSAPAVFGSDNGANQTIVSLNINAPTFSGASFCQSETVTVNFSLPGCNFVNVPAANVFSVELSNAAGSFASPVVIGTRTATTGGAIICTIPPGTSPGNGYRMRVVASSPSVISPDNGTNFSVVAVTGNPTLFGNGKWNVYCYNTRNDFTTNYMGFYTEALLTFNTTNRWATTASPSSVSTATGASNAYVGCPIPVTNVSFSSKRTNIPCGYYQIDINSHRQEVSVIINGSTIFSHAAGGDSHPNVYTGMIVPTDEIEIRCATLSGSGNLAVTFTRLSQIVMSPAVTICSVVPSTATITATNAYPSLPVNYAWTPSATVSPPTGSTTVFATPTITTTYTVFATEPVSGCITASNTILITVAPLPTPATTIASATICSGFSSTSITATGANTYSWAPPTGLNTTTGNVVVASPTVNTTYTVTGDNNCTTRTASRLVTVRVPPTMPSPSAFGTTAWNVFCYNGVNFIDLYGFYAETKLNFNTANRWTNTTSPSNANVSAPDAAYTGCILPNTNHGTISKRTNFTCGYYRIDVNHDDSFTALIDGVPVFTHLSVADAHTGIWTGFLGPSTTVEFRQSSTTSPSFLTASFVIVPIPNLSPPVTICAGSTATFTAAQISGLNYNWFPAANLNTNTGTVVVSSASISTNYTCIVTDPATSCTAGSTVSLTINPLPTTTVSPTIGTVNCVSQNYTLSAGGANTYSWSPSAGLSATTGNSVIASPVVPTIYTVTGDNNCASLSATANIDVLTLINPTVIPTSEWNVYAYNTTAAITASNYYGYYTEAGGGPSGYDFNTTNRWSTANSPSAAVTSAAGDGYIGCPLPTTNWNLSFKRAGFSCGTYSINSLGHGKTLTILVNGTQVASRTTSATATTLWVGVLSSSTTVELRLSQTTGLTASLNIVFAPQSDPASPVTWAGNVSSDWFNTNNWCGGSLPTVSDDVIIHNTGSLFQPSINGSGAACADLTISGLRAAVSNSTSAISAAALTMVGSSSLTVGGNWNGYGTFTPGTGTVNMVGAGTKSINCTTTETFYGLALNNSGDIILSPGTHRISNTMDLISGVVYQNGILQFLTGATATNGNNDSYVDGPIVKFGNQAFTFPTGTGGLYRPIGITAPALVSDNFTAQYFNTDPSPPYTYSLTDASIHHISRCEHWILNRSGGSSIVRVTMSWNVNSCGISDINDLLVARWDAGQVKWKDHGNGSVGGSTTAGTLISAAPVSVFSPFTLGTKSSSNILPIELIDFGTTCVAEGVELKWSTTSERNNNYFVIEMSEDGNNWKEVKKIFAQGNSNGTKAYTYIDRVFPEESIYYRLVQVDKDETLKVFKNVSSLCHSSVNDFKFYPNPASSEISLLFNVSESHPDGLLSIVDNLGRVCFTKTMGLKKGTNTFNLPLHLNKGIYYISYKSYTFKGGVQKLVIE